MNKELDMKALYQKAFPIDYINDLKNKQPLLSDDGSISHYPACWSPHFFLMKMTNAQTADTPLLRKEHLLWNRFYATAVTQNQKKACYILDISALLEDEKQTLKTLCQDYLETLGKQGDLEETPLVIDFSETYWDEQVNFKSFIFTEETNFSQAVFQENSEWDCSCFLFLAHFKQTRFLSSSEFMQVCFYDDARFKETIFSGEVNFADSVFYNQATFQDAIFKKDIYFGYASFKAEANFQGIIFKELADFSDADFEDAFLNFTGARFEKGLNFDYVVFPEPHIKRTYAIKNDQDFLWRTLLIKILFGMAVILIF